MTRNTWMHCRQTCLPVDRHRSTCTRTTTGRRPTSASTGIDSRAAIRTMNQVRRDEDGSAELVERERGVADRERLVAARESAVDRRDSAADQREIELEQRATEADLRD